MRGNTSKGLFVRRITWLGGAIILISAVPDVALADRPGTPNNERAWSCNNPQSEPPTVCLEFSNTANEAVGFDIEFTIDGDKIVENRPIAKEMPDGRPVTPPKLGGVYTPFKDVKDHEIEAVQNFNSDSNHYYHTRGRTGSDNGFGDPLPQQGLMIINLDYGKTYCFRMKSRRASDDMVSDQWSNWACATTAASPPPKPSNPGPIRLVYTPGGQDWRTKPPIVDIFWGGSTNVFNYSVSKVADGGGRRWSQSVHGGAYLKAVYSPEESDFGADGWDSAVRIKVCAENISGMTCDEASVKLNTLSGDAEKKPDIPVDALSLPPETGIVSNSNVSPDSVLLQKPAIEQTSRPNNAILKAPASDCGAGFVHRFAAPSDFVCVTPAAKGRVAQENADSSNHIDPNGAYGPNTCVTGYVWRNAFDGDGACVTPQARSLAQQENAAHVTYKPN